MSCHQSLLDLARPHPAANVGTNTEFQVSLIRSSEGPSRRFSLLDFRVMTLLMDMLLGEYKR